MYVDVDVYVFDGWSMKGKMMIDDVDSETIRHAMTRLQSPLVVAQSGISLFPWLCRSDDIISHLTSNLEISSSSFLPHALDELY